MPRIHASLLLLASAALAQKPEPTLSAVEVIGDSTANNIEGRGWGDPFASYFDPAQVRIVNRARAGRSSRTFFTEGLWDKVAADLKTGDFVLIQFGHNDGGPLDTGRARGSLPGLGDETKEITLPDGKLETVHTCGWYMRQFIAGAKAKGATPILLSLTVRNIWNDGKVERGSGRFGEWAAELARNEKVAFLDVTNVIADQYEKLGEEKVKELFSTDHTHTSPAGADLNASTVVSALKGLSDAPLTKFLSAKGGSVPPTTVHLRLPEPADPKLPSILLIGDSTVRNGRGDGRNGQWGWGAPFFDRFDPAKVNVVNRAWAV